MLTVKKKMGSGVAKALRDKYPTIFNPYALMCSEYAADPSKLLGKVCFVDVGLEVTPNTELIVANCFTQERYGRDGQRYADPTAIEVAIDLSVGFAVELGIPFYMPKIGCGLGGLSWETEVEPIVRDIADKYQINIHVCDI